MFGEGGRIEIGWMVEPATLSKPAIKVLLNLALIAGDALVRGGRLDIGAEQTANGIEMVVRAEGPRLVLDPELRQALEGRTSAEEVTPRAAAAWLASELARQAGGTIQVSAPEDPFVMFGAILRAG
jgi:histidine phosphotransferase ChpT